MTNNTKATGCALVLLLIAAAPSGAIGAGAGATVDECETFITGQPLGGFTGFVASATAQVSGLAGADATSLNGRPVFLERPDDSDDWVEYERTTFAFQMQMPARDADYDPRDAPDDLRGVADELRDAPDQLREVADELREAPDQLREVADELREAPDQALELANDVRATAEGISSPVAIPGQDVAPVQAKTHACIASGGACTLETIAEAAVQTWSFWFFVFMYHSATAQASFHTNIECSGDFLATFEHFDGLGPRIATSAAFVNGGTDARETDRCVYIYPTMCFTQHEDSWTGSATLNGRLGYFELCNKFRVANRMGVDGLYTSGAMALPFGPGPGRLWKPCFEPLTAVIDDTGLQSAGLGAAETIGQQVFDLA